MILKVGELGIVKILNSNVYKERSAILIVKEDGIAPIVVEENKIHYGYNECIVCEDADTALSILELINKIKLYGSEAEKEIDMGFKKAYELGQLFFQESEKK